jgi:hypothetical protein
MPIHFPPALSAVLVVLLAAGDLFAEPSDADRAAARALAQEGQVALDRKNFGVAADRFERADLLVHAPTLLLAMARAQIGLGKLVEAHENFARIQREGVAPGSPKPWTRAYEDAAKELEAVAARLPWVVIQVTGASNPYLTVDGAPVPRAVLGIRRPVNPGKHELRVIADGYRSVTRTFAVVEGQSATINVDMEAEPVPAALIAPTRSTLEPPPPPVGANGKAQLSIGYAVLGVGTAGLVVGGIAGGMFLAKRSELAKDCPDAHCAPGFEQDVTRYHQLGTVSTVGLVVGAAGLATGAILLLSAPRANRVAGSGRAIDWAAYVQVDRVGVRGVF